MEEKSNNYKVLRARMSNGIPFLREKMLTRINYLANVLEIDQEEAAELSALAMQNGCDVLPEDAMGRLSLSESRLDDVEAALTDIFYGGAAV